MGLLGLMLVGFKITGYIDWSWWLVLLPFWIGLAVLLAIAFGGLFIAAVMLAIAGVIDVFLARSRRKAFAQRKASTTGKKA